MWGLLRVGSLAVLAAVALLLAGRGSWLLAVLVPVTGLLDADNLTARGIVPSESAAAAGLGVGLMAALARPASRIVRQFVTLLHELGHVLVAAALGARPSGIVLRHDASGHATARWVGRPGPMRRFALAAMAFAGLPAAAVTSAAGARLLLLAGPEAVLWSFAAAGAVVAVLARSVWSLLVAVSLAALAAAALTDAAGPWVTGVVIALLTALAVKAFQEAMRGVARPIHPDDDARIVGRHLVLPARLVKLVQIAVVAALSAWTVWLLLTPLHDLAAVG